MIGWRKHAAMAVLPVDYPAQRILRQGERLFCAHKPVCAAQQPGSNTDHACIPPVFRAEAHSQPLGLLCIRISENPHCSSAALS